MERLEYLVEKRKYLQKSGKDLRPNRLKEMIDLLTAAGSVTTETDEKTKQN